VLAKQVDRDNLKSHLVNKSFSPVLFLNDFVTSFFTKQKSRDEFWRMITTFENDLFNQNQQKLENHEGKVMMEIENQRLKAENKELEANLEKYFLLKQDFAVSYIHT